MQPLSDKEFDAYLEHNLYTYLQKLEKQHNTDVVIFENKMATLVSLWKTVFYDNVNARPIMSVKESDLDMIAQSITKAMFGKKDTVLYVSSRVDIDEESLLLVIKDIVGKFYFDAPWSRTIPR